MTFRYSFRLSISVVANTLTLPCVNTALIPVMLSAVTFTVNVAEKPEELTVISDSPATNSPVKVYSPSVRSLFLVPSLLYRATFSMLLRAFISLPAYMTVSP